MMHGRVLFLFIIYISSVIRTNAQQFVPVVTNISSLDYHGGLQNWAIKQGANGEIYIGNNNGLLVYDGYHWQTATVPGGSAIRSILVDGDRLYIGSYEEFGYFTKDEYGKMQYRSLWKEIRNYPSHNDEIWNIVKAPDGSILFQSFCSWFTYDRKTVKVNYNENIRPLYFFQVGKKIYAQLIEDGLYEWQNGNLKKVLDRQQLGDDAVVSILPLKGQRMILCTEFHGLYIYDGHLLQKFHTEADDKLRKGQLNRAVITHRDSILVMGTILDGVYGIDMQGHVCWHYDTRNNLRNNTVLGLFCDRDDNVWVALDAGVALIHSGAPYALLSFPDTPLGMVYDVYDKGDHMYVATNQFTYLVTPEGIRAIEGTQGQNWHITLFGNQLIVGNNKGAKILQNNHSIPVQYNDDASSTALHRYFLAPEHDYLIESSYYQLRIYRNVSGNWQFQHTVSGFAAPVRQFEIDNQGVIWAAHMSRGLFRIELSADMRKVEHLQYFGSPDGKGNSQLHVMKIRGEIVVSDKKQLYTVSNSGEFKPFDALNGLVDDCIISATSIDNNSFWLASDRGYAQIDFRNGSYQRVNYLPAAFFGLECGDYINHVRVFNNYTYFCLNGGIGRMSRQSKRTANNKNGLVMAEAYYTTTDHQQFPVRIDGKEESTVRGNITLRLSYPNYNNDPLQFRFHLRGSGMDLSSESPKPEITYNNLKYGSYLFTAEIVNEQGKTLGSSALEFAYPRPAYLSLPAIMLYVLLSALIIYALIRWNTNRRLDKIRQQMEKEKMEQELKMADQQRIIEEQKQKILEQQLQEKGREIATLTMDAVNMDNDEYWRIYRENFDLIHKNFFRTLRERYSTLTATDLKFCALLRLNLGTKDIASFTGLTVRGVEGARYRLRKKLQLSEDTNLTEFLIDLK